MIRYSVRSTHEGLSLVTPGVFAFVNGVDRRCDVRAAANLLVAIGRHLSLLESGQHEISSLIDDKDKLSVWILDTKVDNFHDRALFQSYWVSYFEALGFATYRSRRNLTLKAIIRIQNLTPKQKQIVVKLVNRNSHGITVGVFEKMGEAQEFLERYYISQSFQFPVFACNHQTRLHIRGY